MLLLPDEIPDLPGLLVELLAQIPVGRVTTYGSLADALGNRIAARWVGHFALHHDHDDQCPCHRVVRVDGQLGAYIAGGSAAKARRLAAEGVPVCRGAVDLAQFGFDEFQSDRPLERLRRIQEELAAKVSLRPPRKRLRTAGGVDLSYAANGDGVAAFVLCDLGSAELLWSTWIRRRIAFPYVTTYLSFRELPVLIELLEEVDRQGRTPDVLLVDGSGILHPRGIGIAAHLGVVAAMPTIGVTKKLLCGRADLADMDPMESRPVVQEDKTVGVALRPTAGSRRPIFISPGHKMNLATAEAVVRRLLRGRRLPEPLYLADRESRRAARDSAGASAPQPNYKSGNCENSLRNHPAPRERRGKDQRI